MADYVAFGLWLLAGVSIDHIVRPLGKRSPRTFALSAVLGPLWIVENMGRRATPRDTPLSERLHAQLAHETTASDRDNPGRGAEALQPSLS